MGKYRRFIFEKMLRHGYVGGSHTNIENIPKGKPMGEYREIMAEAKDLLKEGYFIPMRKPDGLHISLNPRRLKEIGKELES